MAELCPLFSGSTGNSYYIGSKSSGILVDIGRSCKQVTTVMQRCGIDPLSVQGTLLRTSTATTSAVCVCLLPNTTFPCLPLRARWGPWNRWGF